LNRKFPKFSFIKILSLIYFLFLLSLSNYSQQSLEEAETLLVSPLTLEQIGNTTRISAIVTDAEGNTLPGVTATFVDNKGIPHTVVSDQTGRLRISLNRELLVGRIKLKLELPGFTTKMISYDLPYLPPPPPSPPPCETQEKILRNREGIVFSSSEIVQKDQSDRYDIYFQNDKFFSRKKMGGIATVGDQGSRRLCDINYPACGYCDCSKIVERHVYLYESYNDNIRAEIRVLSFIESEEVKISYHVRRD